MPLTGHHRLDEAMEPVVERIIFSVGSRKMGRRIGAVIFIFVCTSAAWLSLGGITQFRSEQQNVRLGKEVEGLWGSSHQGETPNVELRWKEREERPMTEAEKSAFTSQQYELAKTKAELLGVNGAIPEITEEQLQVVRINDRRENGQVVASQLKVDLQLEHRQKGLLWFPTYTVGFTGDYQVMNPEEHAADVTVRIPFPAINAVYENLTLRLKQPNGDFNYIVRDRAFWPRASRGDQVVFFVYIPGTRHLGIQLQHEGQMVRISTHHDHRLRPDRLPQWIDRPDSKEKRADGLVGLSWKKNHGLPNWAVMPRKLDPACCADVDDCADLYSFCSLFSSCSRWCAVSPFHSSVAASMFPSIYCSRTSLAW